MVTLTLTLRSPHDVPIRGADVVVRRAGQARAQAEGDTYVVGLDGEGDFQLVAAASSRLGSAFDHRTFRTTLFHRSPTTGEAPELRVLAPAPGELSRVESIRRVEGGWALSIVLDYLWFTHVGATPTAGNRASILIDGEEAWASVADAIDGATQSIHLTTWIYQETAELRRPEPLTDPSDRARYTIHRVLDARAAAGITVRLLLWDAPFIDVPESARRAAETPDDRFEVLQEANLVKNEFIDAEQYPLLAKLLGAHPLYSWHQKSAAIDGRIGFCGGMNIKENDWDTPRHGLFDPRRTRFSRQATFRNRVFAREESPDHAVRHDFMARVEGPAVAHLEANFRERWNHVRDNHGECWSNSTPVDPPAPQPAAGPSAVQVVRTMPPPYDERGILDVYIRAIRAARRLVYIEDQYFRSTHVSDALADAVRTWPGLHVIVVTKRSYANSALQSGWSWECFERIQARRPDLELYTLEVTDVDAHQVVRTREIDIHAKLMLVDDIFLTVGSCNVNDRGFELEGELNLAIVDPALVKDTRLRLWREHLGEDPRLNGDIDADAAVWREHAERNRLSPGGSMVVPFVPTERSSIFDRNAW